MEGTPGTGQPDPEHSVRRRGTYAETPSVGDFVRFEGTHLVRFDPAAELRAMLAAPSVFDDVLLEEE